MIVIMVMVIGYYRQKRIKKEYLVEALIIIIRINMLTIIYYIMIDYCRMSRRNERIDEPMLAGGS